MELNKRALLIIVLLIGLGIVVAVLFLGGEKPTSPLPKEPAIRVIFTPKVKKTIPTSTPAPSATPTVTPKPKPTATPKPKETPTTVPMVEPTATPTGEVTATLTETPTVTPTASPTP